MDDFQITLPKYYPEIQAASEQIGFNMPSDLQTGSLLKTLVASKPGASILELGTGTGLALCWFAEGMDENSQLTTIDNSDAFLSIAHKYFGSDSRINIVSEDGSKWVESNKAQKFDLIFADTWAGKYTELEEVLAMVKKGGFYIIDDMKEQANWPEGHAEKAKKLLAYLGSRQDFNITKMNWSTGIVIATKL
ncbi:O-methyltransferase [Chondrinema litorale]|uniref:O-methyltransferase n=1 Tax=Chondrinema litorale TaxID=2994555 RepID=UPI0025427883|nr:class I SAM-dependent methyltransferase [Chondrinema litorale]UZR94584.1 class I SAM-dependent methyltransferase [Chondrinema litorale]